MAIYCISWSLAAALLTALTACKTSRSGLKIINGVETAAGEFPEVIQLTYSNGQRRCTGSFVSPTTVITAGHCLDSIDPRDGLSRPAGIYYNAVAPALVMMPRGGWFKTAANDFAILVFSEPMGKNFAKISDRQSEVGDEVTFVGFGCTEEGTRNGSGTKRLGKSKIASIKSDGTIVLDARPASGQPTASNICSGDSGGPLYGPQGELIGVNSRNDMKDSNIALQGNITSQSLRAFLTQAVNLGADIPGIAKSNTPDFSSIDLVDQRSYRLAMSKFSEIRKRASERILLKVQSNPGSGVLASIDFIPQNSFGLTQSNWYLRDLQQSRSEEVSTCFTDGRNIKRCDGQYAVSIDSKNAGINLDWKQVNIGEFQAFVKKLNYPSIVWSQVNPYWGSGAPQSLAERLKLEIHAVFADGSHEVYE